jgi:hypothetical protein
MIGFLLPWQISESQIAFVVKDYKFSIYGKSKSVIQQFYFLGHEIQAYNWQRLERSSGLYRKSKKLSTSRNFNFNLS